jgi:membrane-associated phospholipid phosphatase
LHAATALLFAIFMWKRVRRSVRVLLALYPAAMTFTLVYTGEHYVLDVLAGVIYMLASHLAVSRWEARRARRSAVPLAETTALDPPAQEALEAR